MVDDAWDWVQDELHKIQDEVPADTDMMQVVDAISVADFWKRRYDEEQMLWERKIETKEDEKKALQQQSQSHESAIKELNWKLKELEHKWEQEKLMLEDRLKTKEIQAALEKAKLQWGTRIESLEHENTSLKEQLTSITGVPLSKLTEQQRAAGVAPVPNQVQQEAVKAAEAQIQQRLDQLERDKEEIAKLLKDKEVVLQNEREKWSTIEKEQGAISAQMNHRLQKLKEREAEHFEVLEDIARGFAHRVRNYLGIMSGTIQLCVGTYKMEKDLEEQLNVVDQNVQEMLVSIEDFVKFARIPEMHLKPLDINQVLNTSIQSFADKFKIQNVTVQKSLDAHIPTVNGELKLIDEALQHLFQNALESMPDGGTFTVQSQYDKSTDAVMIVIMDTGSGISEAHLKKVFQPYFTTKKGRKGLSLTAARRIVNLHKGTLSIMSEKGKGTSITITLFREEDAPGDQA